MVLEKTLESPLDCKEIQPVRPKADQSWVFIGRTDAEAETSILWPPHAKSWLIGKDPDGGRDWGQEEKETTENEMAGWHHWLNGWVWVNSRSLWWTGRPGMLRFMGSQRVRHDWVTELNWDGRLGYFFLVSWGRPVSLLTSLLELLLVHCMDSVKLCLYFYFPLDIFWFSLLFLVPLTGFYWFVI